MKTLWYSLRIAFLQIEPYQFFAVSVLSQKMAPAQHQYTNDTHVILQVRADSGWSGYPSHNKTVKRNEDMVQNVSIGVWIQERDLCICLGRRQRLLVLRGLHSRESRTRMSPPPRLRKRGNRVNRNPLQQIDGLLASV